MMASMRTCAPSLRPQVWIALLALLASGVAAAQVEPGPASVLVSADLRRSPGDRADVVDNVSAGDEVEVLEIRFDQARVDAGGERGWMPVAKLGARGETATGDAGGRTLLGALSGALTGGGRARAEPSRTVTLDPRGLQRVLRAIDARAGDAGSTGFFLATHPPTAERLDRLAATFDPPPGAPAPPRGGAFDAIKARIAAR